MQDKILSFLKTNGPSTNIDICKGIQLQSYVVDALLSSMVGKTIKKSHKRLGSTRVYYLQGQEERARMRVYKSLEPDQQAFLKKLENVRVISGEEISEEQIEEWQDFMLPFSHNGRQAWHWFEINQSAAKKLLKPAAGSPSVSTQPRVVSAPAAPKPAARPAEKPQAKPATKGKGGAKVLKADDVKAKKTPKVKVPEAGFADKVALWLQSQGSTIGEKKEEKDGFEIEAMMPTALGEQTYLVIVKTPKKKKLGTGDVSDAYSKAVSRKAPVILVSSTGFAKSAEKFWAKGYKNLLTLIDGKNL